MIFAIEATLAQGPATGLGVYVRNLLRELARQAPTAEFLLLHASRRWSGPDFGPNCRPVSYWCGKQSLAIRFRLNAVLRREGAALFHATCTTGAPPSCAVPVIATVHDLYPLIEPGQCALPFRLCFRQLWNWTLQSATAFLANSAFTAAELQRLAGIPPGRITVTPLAADAAPRPRRRPTMAGLPPEPFFLCLGAVEPRKNQLRLADAYAELLRRDPAVPDLLFAGPDRGQGEALAARLRSPQFAGKARWLGEVSGEEREGLYAGALAFLFPSRYEGFGLPVLEAMQRHLPVLAADIPPLREVAGDAALFAAPEDTAAWAAAMLHLARSPETRIRLRDAGLDRARLFSWNRTAAQTLAAYQRLCAPPPGGRQ
ncbi:MAG: glycosyltransferase family 1 protein [Lentisphaeria bacterium]|jgi:alpha-1,3-rhamnosyl/mannosyltransferase